MQHEFDFDLNKLKKVNIDEVRPNTWNPKDADTDEYKNVVKSIKLKGLRQPVIVRENDGYEIIDGQQRWTAAKELGKQHIWVYNEGSVSDEEAKSLTIWYQVQVPFNQVELSHLVVELHNHNIDLPFTESEIADFQELSEFNFDDYSTERPDEDAPKDFETLTINLTSQQYEIVKQALDKVQSQENCTEARAIELICADYLAG